MVTGLQEAARLLGRALGLARRTGLLPDRTGRGGPTRIGAAFVRHALDRLLGGAARRLADSATAEHRDLAAMLASAVEARDYATALALANTAGRRADLRAEKMLSRRYRYLWVCNPKVASRSIIAALREADPTAELIRGRTLEEVFARRPEAREYFSFAFVREPCERAWSCYADKHTLALRERTAARWFIEPWHGLELGMTFGAFCLWLDTPCGSDAFADRHWLSQHRQLRTPDGRLPDFLGRRETLEADWLFVTERLGLPHRPLPRLNARPAGAPGTPALDADTLAALKRRYAEDFRLCGYGAEASNAVAERGRAPPPCPAGHPLELEFQRSG